jgi:hypothetical protein|tara:strand:- start:242 stop:364 length:123 start_codon:yes stop_codon:yes gene_type:complete
VVGEEVAVEEVGEEGEEEEVAVVVAVVAVPSEDFREEVAT